MLNKSRPLISVIIPVYNVEKYLSECINSVINQSYTNYEILLINDGSTDNSHSICLEYESKYNNITVFNQQNKGLSAARNKGIETSKGDYIAFIDSDDLIHKDFLKTLIYNIEDSDISICNVQEFQNSISIDYEINNPLKIETYSGKEMNEFLYLPKLELITIIAPNKLYKKSLWDNNRFPLDRLHEDCFIIYKVIDKATTVKLIDTALYFYRKRNDSITASRTFKSLKDEYEAASEQIIFFQQRNQLEIIKNANRFRKSLLLLASLDKNWDTWKNYTILNILKDELRTKIKLKLIQKKIRLFFIR